MSNSLSFGAIEQMMQVRRRNDGDPSPPPVLQVMKMKDMGSNLIRLVVSDGRSVEQAILTSKNREIPVSLNSLIRINEFLVNDQNGRLVIFIPNADVLETLPPH